MAYTWEADFGGDRIQIEVAEAAFFDKVIKSGLWGLLGRAKTRAIMLFGRELVARREVKDALFGANPEFDLVGIAHPPSGQAAHLHAIVTPGLTGVKCRLSIDGHEVPLRESPQSSYDYVSRGYGYGEKGEYDKALADFDKAIALGLENATVYGNRGMAYNGKGDYDRAMADFTKAIALDPKNATAYESRGTSYDSKGDYDKAIADFDQAIALDHNAIAFMMRGSAYGKKGVKDKAIADFEKAVELGLQGSLTDEVRTLVVFLKKDFDKAWAVQTRCAGLDLVAELHKTFEGKE